MRRRNERSQKARKEWENVDKERVKDSWWKDQSRRCDEEARLERKGIRMRHISLCPWISTWSGGGGGGLVAKSCLTLGNPWTVACQAPPSMGFSRQEYWSGLLFPSPGDLPDPGIEPMFPVSPALQADSLVTETSGKPVI